MTLPDFRFIGRYPITPERIPQIVTAIDTQFEMACNAHPNSPWVEMRVRECGVVHIAVAE
jgi:hypothetical protein